MPTPGEKRALLFLASVAALGVAVRGWQSREPSPLTASDRAGLARQIGLVDSAITAGGTRKRARARQKPLAEEGASDSEPSAPRRARRSKGTLAASEVPVEAGAQPDNRARYFAQREREDRARAQLAQREGGTRRSKARGSGAGRRRGGEGAPVDLDVATEEEIGAVRGIGPALARRIVADRVQHGPFGSIDELRRVRGIGAALARRIASSVTFSQPPVTHSTPEAAGGTVRARKRRGSPLAEP